MKSPRLLTVLVVLLLLFLLDRGYCGENYVEYKVQINGDRSASWAIMVVSDVNATVDDWASFQQRLFTLVEATRNVTYREMAILPETIQMETVIVWETQSKTTQFRFKWLNFSKFEDGDLVFGDVFGLESYFTELYGDGTLNITYDADYSVLNVSPSPDSRNDDLRTLQWFRSQDFLSGKPSMRLTASPSALDNDMWAPYVVLGLVLAAAFLASLGGFYLARRLRSKVMPIGLPAGEPFVPESEEEKVIRFLRSSGGSINQSGVGEQLGFSKAKTSQLLSSLERKGAVARYKKGRDKIVKLIEQTAGDES